MEIGSIKFQKLVVLAVAILFGFTLSLDEWELLWGGRYLHPFWQYFAIPLLQFFSYTLFAWYIWYLNLFETSRDRKWNILISFVVLIAFIGVQAFAIDPYVSKLNRLIYEGSRDWHHRRFHDDLEDWAANTIWVFIICQLSGWVFLLFRNKVQIEKKYEKLQQEAMRSQINALTNQINPHFFFNSLNSLYSLVFTGDKEKSLQYITKMSEVFRYILQSDEKRLVPLREEMDFLHTYLFMLTIKYDQKLRVIYPDSDTDSWLLPVLSLLPLIENVTKHNEISNQYPMTVHIYIDTGGCLVVSNEKKERLLEAVSVGVGLKNLNDRFLLITGKEIQIEDTESMFTVRLPLVKAKRI